MRACFIGNSHLAAIKKGWDQIASDHPDVKCDMFASLGATLTKTFVRDGTLCSANEEVRASLLRTGGQDRIALNEYDFFVIVGCNIRIDQLWQILATHNFIESDGQLISKNCLSAYLTNRFAKSCAAQLVKKIRSAVSAPILMMPHPYPDCRMLERPRAKGFADLKRAGALAELKAIFEDACSLALASKAELIFQDISTVNDEIFTRQEFSTGAPRLLPGEVEHAQQELLHMNADYGIAMLKKLLSVDAVSRMHGARRVDEGPRRAPNAEFQPPAGTDPQSAAVAETAILRGAVAKKRFQRFLKPFRG